ncbi:MAG: hypothetical protein Tsb009_15310 [Planctomycetaceae bacterium]
MTDAKPISDDQLQNYLMGTLNEDELAAIEKYLDEDPQVLQRLIETDANLDDTLFSQVQMEPPPSQVVNDSAYQRGLELVAAIGRDWSQGVGSPKADSLEASPSPDGSELGSLRDYRLLEKIGEGGMGSVYKAVQTKLGKVVAIKVLPQQQLQDKEAVRRFDREMKAVGKLDHPNIVRATDAGEHDGQHFLVMEYVKGVDLAEYVRKCGPLDISQAIEIIRQAAEGLQYAHSQGLIHRDIKPSNLMISGLSNEDGSSNGSQNPSSKTDDNKQTPLLKILDLGLARLENDSPHAGDEHPELTTTGVVMGTVDYMSPEQAIDTHAADAQSDIYSLGCTLYFLLNGRAPYSGKSVMERLIAHREQPIPKLIPGQSSEGSQLEAIFQKMIAKKPEERFTSMADVLSAIESLNLTHDATILLDRSTLEIHPSATTTLRPTAEHETAEYSAAGSTDESSGTSIQPRKNRLLTWGATAAGTILGLVSLAAAKRPGKGVRRGTPVIWGASAVAVLAGVIWIATDKSRWKIETQGDGVEVTSSGESIVARDTQTGTTIHVSPSGTKVNVKGNRNNVKLREDGFELSRDGKTIATGKKKTHMRVMGMPEMAPRGGPMKLPALAFDGVDDYVHIPTLPKDTKSSITLEAWVNMDANAPIPTVMEVMGLKLRYYTLGSQWMTVGYTKQNSDATVILATPPQHDKTKVYHVACVYDGKLLRLFIDGILRAFIPQPKGRHYHLPGKNQLTTIGHSTSLHRAAPFRGTIREVRISNTARYVKDFRPQQRFTPDEHTLALYHFDERQGTKLIDSSGNNHHGIIVGATWAHFDGTPLTKTKRPASPSGEEEPVKAKKPRG